MRALRLTWPACCVVLAAVAVPAAEQAVPGSSFTVRDPQPGGDASRRSLLATGKAGPGVVTLAGDPTQPGMAGGGVLEVFADGGTARSQVFVLPQGTGSTGKPFWKAARHGGFAYRDPRGEQGPVRSVDIVRSGSGAVTVKAKLSGRYGPIDVVPPDPGTSACVALKLGLRADAGDRYSLLFDGDGTLVNDGAERFTVRNPVRTGVCRRTPVTVRTVRPPDTDPQIDTRAGDHVVAVPVPGTGVGQLVLFFPGTRGRPDQYTTFVRHAAGRGFHAVALDYENSASINFEVCPGQPPDCPEAARLEILTGAESPYIEPDVGPANSAFNRIARLLAHQRLAHPTEGWEEYLAGDQPRWDRVVAAGHSQGGGHAAMTAKLHQVARALLFGATEPAAWTLTAFATPASRFWGLAHRSENSVNGMLLSWQNIGVPGTPVEVVLDPPGGASHRLLTTVATCSGNPSANGYYHNCYTVDGWMPPPAPDGSPAFAPVWAHMLTAP